MNEFYCDGENSYINFVSSECWFTRGWTDFAQQVPTPE